MQIQKTRRRILFVVPAIHNVQSARACWRGRAGGDAVLRQAAHRQRIDRRQRNEPRL